MTEEGQFIIEEAEERMQKAIEHLSNELAVIRAGKANPRMLDGVMVDYYGSMTPLNQVSNIGTPDPKTIAIQPWEKNMIEPIEKAIMAANLGLQPINNGELIRINIPALTEERRKSLGKQVSTEGENAKVSVRSARRDANDEFKKLGKEGMSEDDVKEGEETIQELTNKYSKKIDELVEAKQEDIMKV